MFAAWVIICNIFYEESNYPREGQGGQQVIYNREYSIVLYTSSLKAAN